MKLTPDDLALLLRQFLGRGVQACPPLQLVGRLGLDGRILDLRPQVAADALIVRLVVGAIGLGPAVLFREVQ
jgi:hypothetical protein